MSRLVFYNAGPPSKTRPGSASRDLGGLLHEYRPRAAIACEVIGDRLEPQPGYSMIRDRSRPGRANLVGYVREDCTLRRSWWIDHTTTWSRTETTGTHPARSTLVLGIGSLQLLGAHNVPLGTDATEQGQRELVRAIALVMTPWRRASIRREAPELDVEKMRARPRVVLWDDNAPADHGLGGDYLAEHVGGQRHGEHIDNAVTRQLAVESVEYVHHAGGVQLATDHPWGALVVHVARGSVDW